MKFTRKELIETDATMNQMRNAVYILVRLMEKNGIKELKENFRKMGRNIARTYINYWKPIEVITLKNLKDVITTIYQKVLNSTVSIEINELEKEINIQDYKCALCKYHHDDLEIAGCEILLGMISEFILLINQKSYNSSSIFLEPHIIKQSRAFGDKSCIQTFKYKTGTEG